MNNKTVLVTGGTGFVAYFQISKQNLKPTDVYLEVGVEDLSHFSFVFKKQFGFAPSEVGNKWL